MLKKMINSAVSGFFSLIGYKVNFSKKGNQATEVINKHIWEPYFNSNQKMQLYLEGIKCSRNEWSDNFYKQLRFYSLQQMVHYAVRQGVKGDFAECGCWKGHSAYLIADILTKSSFSGDFHIFDAFEGGLSEKVEKDRNLVAELSEERIKEESRIFSSTEAEVKACLSRFKFFHLYKGWIPERFNEVKDKQFAFVHIDVDLYEPTLESIKFFYPRLAKDGVIVCDDYGLTQFPGAKKAVDEFLQANPYRLFYEVPMGGCFIIK